MPREGNGSSNYESEKKRADEQRDAALVLVEKWRHTEEKLKKAIEALEKSMWHHDSLNDYSMTDGYRICAEALEALKE